MRRRTFIGAVVAAGSALAGRFPAFAQSDDQVATPATGGTDMANAHVTSGYAPVNGLQMYYEIHGTGEPLVLLHGGVAASDIFDPLLPMFAESRQVITIDLQAHGCTRDIDRPLRYEAMADDIAALIAHLGLRQADLMGYSMGGGVALQTAIRHPELVDRLVVVSMTMKRDGSYPEVLSVVKAISNFGLRFIRSQDQYAPDIDVVWTRIPHASRNELLPHLARVKNDRSGNIFLVAPLRDETLLSSMSMLFLLAYVMGMLVRYYPSIWQSLVARELGDVVYPLLRAAMVLVRDRFPDLIVDELEEAHPRFPRVA